MSTRLFRPLIVLSGLLFSVACENGPHALLTPTAAIQDCKLTTSTPNKTIELQTYSSVLNHVQLTSNDHSYLLDFGKDYPFKHAKITIPANQTSDQKITWDVELSCFGKGECYYPFKIFNEDAGHTLCQDPGVHIIRGQ